jgi:poly [ADP-ribose] polymerase
MAKHLRKFVCTDVDANNNKFWQVEWDDSDMMVTVTHGRVGDSGRVTPPKYMSLHEIDKLIRSKTERTSRAAYKEISVIGASGPAQSHGAASSSFVMKAAKEQLARNDPELEQLVTHLAKQNKHQLVAATGGKIDIDLQTGMVTTPVGIITKETVDEARPMLDKLAVYSKKHDMENTKRKELIAQYLMLIPQVVGRHRNWHLDFLVDDLDLQKQNTLLDQLATSADMAMRQVSGDKSQPTALPLFDAKIEIVKDLKDIKRIERMFLDSINSSHTSRHLRPKRVYSIYIPHMDKGFTSHGAKLSNIWQLWHGTRVFNVLSILKHGFIVPPTGASHVTGRMFGDGLYASDQSTKALNYAQGYWDGGPRDNNCFMFMVDFAMGNYYTPKYSGSSRPAGYDSIYAKAGQSGVMNNEMIVPKTSQCNPKYLIEFSDGGR